MHITLRRWYFSILVAAATTFYAGFGAAQLVAECVNDDECANAACGGDVCQWDTQGNRSRGGKVRRLNLRGAPR